ncbi:putative membrane protein [Pectinatus haikarae]|uniref:Membrane protein n=2 Tax=Pectinatus haikarae TaxID=349096 RepID=A0ABT9YA87_9FIRM|nr:putative membrane protein [Pectinatus haikarae]
MEQGVTLAVPLGILLAILMNMETKAYKRTFFRALSWGFWGSVFIIAVKVGTRNAVSREVFESLAIAVAVFCEIAILLFFFRKNMRTKETIDKKVSGTIAAMVVALFLYHGMEIWLIPVTTMFTAAGDYFNITVLIRLVGFATGLGFSVLGGYLVHKAAAALYYQRLLFVFTVQMAAILLQQIIFLIQIMMARQLLPGGLLMKIMAPLINHQSWIIFVVFFVTVLVPVTLFLQKKPLRPQGTDPAQYRKILMYAKHKLRWGTAVVISLCIMVSISSLGSVYANKKEALVPAIPVNAVDGNVSVSLDQVNDGHLHRYVYKASGGELVRFIIIQKGGSSYGVGLDACEICGPTGYYEKDGQVVCRLCDVIMNKATIGMKGGCNPIPVEYKVENGRVNVTQASLEKDRDKFK